jgi:hypothetical protein
LSTSPPQVSDLVPLPRVVDACVRVLATQGSQPIDPPVLRALLRRFATKFDRPGTNRLGIPRDRLGEVGAALQERAALGDALAASGERVTAGAVLMARSQRRRGHRSTQECQADGDH